MSYERSDFKPIAPPTQAYSDKVAKARRAYKSGALYTQPKATVQPELPAGFKAPPSTLGTLAEDAAATLESTARHILEQLQETANVTSKLYQDIQRLLDDNSPFIQAPATKQGPGYLSSEILEGKTKLGFKPVLHDTVNPNGSIDYGMPNARRVPSRYHLGVTGSYFKPADQSAYHLHLFGPAIEDAPLTPTGKLAGSLLAEGWNYLEQTGLPLGKAGRTVLKRWVDFAHMGPTTSLPANFKNIPKNMSREQADVIYRALLANGLNTNDAIQALANWTNHLNNPNRLNAGPRPEFPSIPEARNTVLGPLDVTIDPKDTYGAPFTASSGWQWLRGVPFVADIRTLSGDATPEDLFYPRVGAYLVIPAGEPNAGSYKLWLGQYDMDNPQYDAGDVIPERANKPHPAPPITPQNLPFPSQTYKIDELLAGQKRSQRARSTVHVLPRVTVANGARVVVPPKENWFYRGPSYPGPELKIRGPGKEINRFFNWFEDAENASRISEAIINGDSRSVVSILGEEFAEKVVVGGLYRAGFRNWTDRRFGYEEGYR